MAQARNRPRLAMVSFVLGGLCGCLHDADKPAAGPKEFRTDVAGLAAARAPAPVDLKDGDTLTLEAAPVKKTLKGFPVRMLAFNGSIPGPVLRVRQGAQVVVRFVNRTGFPNALHSHGLRLDNAYDGNQMMTQPSVEDGESFLYHLRFPDAGLYWYHAHERTDYFQEMGLAGTFLVQPSDPAYWGPVNREEVLVLDDFALDTLTGKPPAYGVDSINRTMMGRWGNVYLVNGDTSYNLEVKRKERVRFYAVNVANVRTFNLGLKSRTPGDTARIKVMGSDNGRYETSILSATELVAPAERTIFEAYFDKPGTYDLVHEILEYRPYNFAATVVLGHIRVLNDSVDTPYGANWAAKDTSFQTIASIDSVRGLWPKDTLPDKELLLTGKMGQPSTGLPGGAGETPAAPAGPLAHSAAHDPGTIDAKGIEWTDNMGPMNAVSSLENMRWMFRDVQTGKENHAIQWKFKRGDKVRIRIRGDGDPLSNSHNMPHPIHFHGQRFLVLYVNGRRNPDMAWEDTHLVGMRETVDILLDASNPGVWMAQCHIAEHSEDMMMFHFTVE